MYKHESPIFVASPLLPELSAVEERLKQIWDSKWLTNIGPQHKELESALRQHLRVPELSLFCNGTIALLTAGKALNLSGEVITTPFSFAATPHSLSWMGVDLVFGDIDPHTLNLLPEAIERAITPRTTGIMATHVFGTPCDVEAIEDIAKRHNLKVVYDGAHAFGLEVNNRGIGSYGDITMYSFHATKLFHTVEGGALSCQDPDMKQHIDMLKNFAIRNEEEVFGIGINGKLNEVQAAIGLSVLSVMDKERTRRVRIYDIYKEVLTGVAGLEMVKIPDAVTRRSLQYMPVLVRKSEARLSRNELHTALKEYNIITRKYFHPLCTQYDCYKDLPSAAPDQIPNATRIGSECLALPYYGSLKDEEAYNIAEVIRHLLSSPMNQKPYDLARAC